MQRTTVGVSRRAELSPSIGRARHMVRAAAERAALEGLEGRTLMSVDPILVTNTADHGAGSLRAAIDAANADADASIILFAIPQPAGGPVVQHIALSSALPAITAPVTLDATSESGYLTGRPIVELTGPASDAFSAGLVLRATSTVMGLALNGFGRVGIEVAASAPHSVLQYDFVGTDAAGRVAVGNGQGVIVYANDVQVTDDLISGNGGDGLTFSGVTGGLAARDRIGTDLDGNALQASTDAYGQALFNGSAVVIGTSTGVVVGGSAADGNLLAGNSGNGVWLEQASNATVTYNYIGTSAAGDAVVRNNGSGVQVDFGSAGNLVAWNLIAGSGGNGITVSTFDNRFNEIAHNRIGTDAAGALPLANEGNGIALNSAGTLVHDNLVSGNAGHGIFTFYGDHSTIVNNLIGTDATGTLPLGNDGAGVYMFTGSENAVTGNTIAFNGAAGVAVYSGLGNAIRQNAIFSNARIGIDLGDDGVTPNDAYGHDDGSPNLYQNFPLVTGATSRGSRFTLTGTASGPAGATITLDFYLNDAVDPTGYGQGQVYLGSWTVTLDASGNASFTAAVTAHVPSSLAPQFITATATDADGNTSEFSLAQPLTVVPLIATTTTLGSSANPSVPGQAVTLTATVMPAAGGMPTGTVTFRDGSVVLGTATLDATGRASITRSDLLLGDHYLTATYEGDDTFDTSASLPLDQAVAKDASHAALTSTLNPAVYGQLVTFTASIVGVGTFVGMPTGTVTLYDGLTQLGSASLDASGTATWSFSQLSAGHHLLHVVYAGDATFNGDASVTLDQVVNKANAAVTLASSQNPSFFGRAVTFTANVSLSGAGASALGGLVTFMDGTMSLGTAVVTNGVATLTTAALSVGTHAIVAVYSGDDTTAGATSDPLAQQVNSAVATATLSSSANPSAFGQRVTFTATVGSNFGTPGGTVTLYDGNTPLGAASLDSAGRASWSFDNLTVGDHLLTVAYAGDATFNATVSPVLDQVVQKAGTATTITSLLAPTVYGQSVTFTAMVSVVGSGAGTPGGAVDFYDGNTVIGSGPLDANGYASFTTATLTPGNHAIHAAYVGSTNFLPSVSAAVVQTVGLDASETVLNSSANPSIFGQAVRFTATVINDSNGTLMPTGTVTFYDGPTMLGSATLGSGGAATLTLASLSVGTHAISAVYSGDAFVAASTSPTLAQAVTRAAASATLASSLNPSVYKQPVTLTATVPGVPGTTPGGSVVFYDGATQLGSATLDATGVATFTVARFAVGHHALTAAYGGDASYQPATSAALDQLVNKANTKTALAASATDVLAGQSVTFTANVSVLSPSSGVPTGTVTFTDGATLLGTAAIDANGNASLTTAALAVGKHTVTATYAGDDNNVASNSAPVTTNVSALATIGGHVYTDKTGDGMTADDAPMAGVTVQLFRDTNNNGAFDASDVLLTSAMTPANGAYAFTNLKAGAYLVMEVVPTGYVRTAPLVVGTYAVSAANGSSSLANDFDNFQTCNCKADLTSYWFTDNGQRLSDLRDHTHHGDTVSVTFTLKPGETDSFYLVVYSAPGATFDPSTASQQQVIQVSGGSFTGGTHTLTVKLPKTGHYQVDFICGPVLTHFGPAGSNIFYTPQQRLISADNE